MMLTEEGIAAVRIARSVIVNEVTGKRAQYDVPSSFTVSAGVFVTIHTYPSMHLRGCIGYPEPVLPLIEALEHSARSACHDPRFADLRKNELDSVVTEVTILTPPEEMIVKDRNDLLNMIKIGRDGVMLEYRGRRGVFLPQVPAEWGWDVKEYLENLCGKAGIGKDRWKEPDCRIYSFQGKQFTETSPNGSITEVSDC